MSGSTQLVGPNAVYPGLPTQTSLQQIIFSYLYQQYADDDNLQAFVIAQNQIATQYLLWFNTLNLPIYTGGVVAGPLLDWVAQGLYGISRPSITTGTSRSVGAMNSFPMNAVVMDGQKTKSTLTQQTVNDDIFRRVLTWNLYKGDGFVFNIQWLKRRVLRFLNGANGISPVIDNTYAVSVSVAGTVFTVAVPTGVVTTVTLLNSLIQSGACITPFQYSFTVATIVDSGLFNDGGVLALTTPPAGYPTGMAGLAAGAFWSNGGAVSVITGTTPSPTAAPVFFGSITSANLLALGGANLPLRMPMPGSGQIWNPGNGEVWIA